MVAERSAALLPPLPKELMVARQVAVAAGIAPLASAASFVNILLLGIFAVPGSYGLFRILWIASSMAVAVVMPLSMRSWARSPGSRSPWPGIVLCAEVAVGGLLNVALAWRVYPHAGSPNRIIMMASLAGVIGCGAMALSTLRYASLTWILANSAAPAAAFAATRDRAAAVLSVDIVLYVLGLAVGVLLVSGSFRARCIAEHAAEVERELVGLLLDDFEGGASDWLWQTSPTGTFVHVSDRFCDVSGLSERALKAVTWPTLLTSLSPAGPDDVSQPVLHLQQEIADGRPFQSVVCEVSVNGARRFWSISGQPIDTGIPGSPCEWRGVGSDVTIQQVQYEELARAASTDFLTGLLNRLSLDNELETALSGPRSEGIVLAVLDVDNFKSVNDTMGHPIGDALLVQLAARIRSMQLPGEACARLGGDEFAILLPASSPRANQARLTAYLGALSSPFSVGGRAVALRASAGYTTASGAFDEDAQELLIQADLALYAAKEGGRNRIHAFTPSLRQAAERRAQLAEELQLAVERNEFDAFFQPQVSLHSNDVVAFEALARWRHPTRGLLEPGSFIQFAEEAGLIEPIGIAVLTAACIEATRWPSTIRLAVNVSPVQLESADFTSVVEGCLRTSGLDPCRLELEVTETTLVSSVAQSTLAEVTKSGVTVSIDDFGTGYSSFASLHALAPTLLKIDRSLVTRVTQDPAAETVLRAIVDMARALNLATAAEGIETQGQREVVRRLGCDLVQGYLESRPMAADHVEEYLSRRRTGSPAAAAHHIDNSLSG